jgi:hypothetical protein
MGSPTNLGSEGWWLSAQVLDQDFPQLCYLPPIRLKQSLILFCVSILFQSKVRMKIVPLTEGEYKEGLNELIGEVVSSACHMVNVY